MTSRAAVVAAENRGTSWQLMESDLRVRADADISVAAKVVLLPPGVRAYAIGATALIAPAMPEWRAAGLGELQRVEFRVPNWCAEVLHWAGRESYSGEEVPGPLDLPVAADPASGRIEAVAVAAVVEELLPLRDLGVKLFKTHDSPLAPVRFALGAPAMATRAARSFAKDWKGALKGLRDEPPPTGGRRPDDASHPPVEGVGYQAWVTVRAKLACDRVQPQHADAYATFRGIPAGRWAAIDAAWAARAASDDLLARWAGFDGRRLQVAGAAW